MNFNVVLAIVLGIVVIGIAYSFYRRYYNQSKYASKVVTRQEDGIVVVREQYNNGDVVLKFFNPTNFTGRPDITQRVLAVSSGPDVK